VSTQHDLCRAFLVAARAVAKRKGDRTDRGFGVTSTTNRRYWLVQDKHGKTIYEGQACCAWDARSHALMADVSTKENAA
jgi:hypothetical protein